ncbi:MAG: SRPBCC family protein [Actinomycetota bacterium]
MKRWVAIMSGGAVAFGTAYAAGRSWGATRAEQRATLPGDDLVEHASGVTTHAITIAAPPNEVWPWMVQMGYHRGGWYTYPWVDRYIWHIDNPSADRIVPELQDVRVGSIIPDGEPGTAWYVVERIERDRLLVLRSSTHIPREIRERYPWLMIDWTWTFFLEPLGDRTRLIVRARAHCEPLILRALFHLMIVPSDFVMERSMLRGIKARAQARRATSDRV